jgi:hypothetical protein
MASDGGYYIPVGNLMDKIFARTEPTINDTGINGGAFSTASWATLSSNTTTYRTVGNPISGLISTPGGCILKDMGRTVVSANRTFRKIQLVTNRFVNNSSFSTFGVGGQSGTNPVEDYLTGYIEVGFEGNGTPAPVAHYGR